MASPEHKKTRTGDNLPSTAATNRFSGRVAIVTGGASGIYPSHTTRYHCHIGRIAERSRSSCLLMLYNKSVYFELAHAQASCCSGSLGCAAAVLSRANISHASYNLLCKTLMCTAGIGKATVERLASEGATVAIFDINKAAGEQVAAEFCSKSLDVKFFEVDVTSKQLCVEATRQFVQMNDGKLHFLVNCAVYFGSKGLTAEKKDWDKSFGVNVVGYSNMVQSCYEYMKGVPGDKSIVNLSSASGYTAQQNRWTYSSTKAAILTMTKGMALDLAKESIRVNSISPGWVWGPEVAKAAVGGREKWEPIWGKYHMLRRFAECSEIASAVCFLLSADASFVTATDLHVDGGYLSMGPEGLGESSSFAGSDY